MQDIQRLMGAIVFSGRPGGWLPPQYGALLAADAAWAAAEAEFIKQACSLLGQVRRPTRGRWGCWVYTHPIADGLHLPPPPTHTHTAPLIPPHTPSH